MNTARRAQDLEAKYAELLRMEETAKARDDWPAANALALEAAQVERTLAALAETGTGERQRMRQYWRHATSGEVFAVEVTEDGQVTGVAGPLHFREIGDLDDHDYDAEDAEDMTAHQDAYRLHER